MGKSGGSKSTGHTIADHKFGTDLDHWHAGEIDHDHDYPGEEVNEDHPIWIADHVSLTTVGIDIGSSGTQVVFSRLMLRRVGEELTSRYCVVSRETLFQSPVTLTPYQSEERIDERRLTAIIDEAYAAVAMRPDAIDTGAVILTGEALRRENAQAVARIVAERGGDFVCASAGHHMEARLAAFGSGAARLSSDTGIRILNVDIGGGTTKLAVVEGGGVLASAALHIGGRLQVMDAGGRIVRLDPAGKHLALRAGFSWRPGDCVDAAALDGLADWMASALIAALCVRPLPPDVGELFLTEPIADLGRIDGMMFSGGVAEYVYRREGNDFGDMGWRLGHALRQKIDRGELPWRLLPAGECIRATALGASQYSVQLSGNTSYISDPAKLLPRRNLQVVRPHFRCCNTIDPHALAAAIRQHLMAFDVAVDTDMALALSFAGEPDYPRLAAFAEGISLGLADWIAQGRAIYVLLDRDVAQTLGGILRDETGLTGEVLVIDGVDLWDFDYIDLGRMRLPSNTVPVTIKSLVFREDPQAPASKDVMATT